MRQGRASRDGPAGRKPEPHARGVNVVGVSQLGAMQGNHATDKGDLPIKKEPLFAGSSFNGPRPQKQGMGPGGGRTIHRSGSQGHHK